MKSLRVLLTIMVFFSVAILADTKKEIDHLLGFVANSTCKFERNGVQYNCNDAKEHILKKYEYFKEKDKIHSAEDFIRYAATKSELSGRKYRAHCTDMTEDSSNWLLRELVSYRKKQL